MASLISFFRKKIYVVAKFQKREFGRQEVEVLPRKWLFNHDNSVYWPEKSQRENTIAVRDMSDVAEDWVTYDCEVITDASE